MSDPSRPYWVDDLRRKHEAYWYGDDGSEIVEVPHEGRLLKVLSPSCVRPAEMRVSAANGDLLFLVGKTLEPKRKDDEFVDGGDGVVIVAKRHPERSDTYCVVVWHFIFPETLRMLEG